MATVAIVYRTDKPNKENECPILIRITKNRKSEYISSGIKLEPQYWDKEKNRIKSNFRNSAYHNNYLITKFAEVERIVIECETQSKDYTSRTLKEKVMGKSPTDFFPFSESIIESYESKGQIGTADLSWSILDKLKQYVLQRNIAFQDITVTFLEKYEKYLRKEFQNSASTIHRDMKFIRRMFNKAIKKGIIDITINPFLTYELRATKAKKEYLTEDELKLIENVTIESGSRVELYRNMFVFAAYAGGLRVSDILMLKWSHFDGEKIHSDIKKTDGQISIKLPNKALEILHHLQSMTAGKYIFPMLPEDLNEADPRELDAAISRATASINKGLKTIATKCEIKKNVSFHISRHTFATRALTKGVSIDKVSKLMEHSKITQTQDYAKIVSEELDKAMDVFN